MEQANTLQMHKNYDVGRRYGVFAAGLNLWLCIILLISEFAFSEEIQQSFYWPIKIIIILMILCEIIGINSIYFIKVQNMNIYIYCSIFMYCLISVYYIYDISIHSNFHPSKSLVCISMIIIMMFVNVIKAYTINYIVSKFKLAVRFSVCQQASMSYDRYKDFLREQLSSSIVSNIDSGNTSHIQQPLIRNN